MMRAWISILTAALLFAVAGCSKTDDAADVPPPADSPSTMPAPAPDEAVPPPSEDTTPPEDSTMPPPPQEQTPPPQQ